jgi:hypothetical protein
MLYFVCMQQGQSLFDSSPRTPTNRIFPPNLAVYKGGRW